MRRFIVRLLATVGAVTLLVFSIAGGFLLVSRVLGRSVPARTILELDFDAGLIERPVDDPVYRWSVGEVVTVREVVDALDRAAEDDRVVAVLARVSAAPMAMAAVQEVRDAVGRFRRSGKPAVAWAETIGEFGRGDVAYYLATAFDRIQLQPSGNVGLSGLRAEVPFARGTLEKIGVEPRIERREEFKSAPDFYTERGFREPAREALRTRLESKYAQLVAGIANGRGLSPDEVRRLIEGGPYLAAEALDTRLIDGIAYRDEVYDRLRAEVGEDAKLLYPSAYLARAGRPHDRGAKIALIYGVGAIVLGSEGYDPVWDETFMGSDTVAAAFREAIDDDDVRAIVFRVDSPGGSYVASDLIRRETLRAHEEGKPVIVSMGALAASGGYFVSMDADRIVAQPATLTGSIGVYAGKLLTGGMWEKLGVSWGAIETTPNAGFWSALEDYDTRGRESLDKMLDAIYEDFTRKVAEGRDIPIERVREIARGRVWTGEQALDLGLVDELGGLETALVRAREAAGLAADAPIRLEVLPRRRSLWQQLFGAEPDNSEPWSSASLRTTLKRLQELARIAAEIGLDPRDGVLRAPLHGPVDP